MKEFNAFKIVPVVESNLTGTKIKIDRILNCKVIIYSYQIKDSKFYKKHGNDKCLYLQIGFEGIKRVVFCQSQRLIAMIEQIPKEEFPFTTTVIRSNEYLEFT